MCKEAVGGVPPHPGELRRSAGALSERRLRRWLSVLSVCARRRGLGPRWAGSAVAFPAVKMFAGMCRALITLCWCGGGNGDDG